MGGVPSTVQNNDELVEYLLHNRYIRRKEVEIIFRAVDRADYVLPSHQESAYNDFAWKHGNLHLSAPCVYAVAMEFLALKPGQSFLNIGSGTGYFSTMAGLLLGPYGVNHGIELREDCIHYARDRLKNFKQKSQALEEFEFCEPRFIQGNCLRAVPSREYDTVYCGAAVSENNITAVKRFVRIGGSVVMPYKGRLCCFKRFAETGWRCKKSLGVSFATLVTPEISDQNSITLPDSEPLSLQELCRSQVRQLLRKNIWKEHPELEKRNLSFPYRQTRTDPLFGQSEDEDSSDDNENEEDDDDEEEEEDDDDNDDDDDDDNDDAETEGHIIRRTRFLFNMEVDSNEPTSNPLLLSQRVAMLVRQRIGAQQQRAEALLDRITEEIRNEPPAAAGSASSSDQDGSSGAAENHSMETSQNFVPLDFWGNSQGDCSNPQQTSNERNPRDSESGRDSEYDSDDEERLTQWKKIPKRENTDSGIVDDVNDTSSSFNVDQSDSVAEDSDDMDVDLSNVVLRETFRQACEGLNKNFTPREPPADDTPVLDSVESRLFVTYMKEKIQLLPLPGKIKLYINHNRDL